MPESEQARMGRYGAIVQRAFIAASEGKKSSDNPYPVNTWEHDAWAEGLRCGNSHGHTRKNVSHEPF